MSYCLEMHLCCNNTRTCITSPEVVPTYANSSFGVKTMHFVLRAIVRRRQSVTLSYNKQNSNSVIHPSKHMSCVLRRTLRVDLSSSHARSTEGPPDMKRKSEVLLYTIVSTDPLEGSCDAEELLTAQTDKIEVRRML